MDLANQLDEEILIIATPIMDNLMEGSTEKDWEKHTRYHTERARKMISRDELERQCKEYQSRFGNFADREFMGVTRHQHYVNVIWKQKMTNSTNEYVATLSLVQSGDRYLVDRCWVDLWDPES